MCTRKTIINDISKIVQVYILHFILNSQSQLSTSSFHTSYHLPFKMHTHHHIITIMFAYHMQYIKHSLFQINILYYFLHNTTTVKLNTKKLPTMKHLKNKHLNCKHSKY